MHIKFLARGTGSARAKAEYLLGARDAAGQPREGVEVLRGDPHRVAAVADALAFEIGIGEDRRSRSFPSHTTRHAGPHLAVR